MLVAFVSTMLFFGIVSSHSGQAKNLPNNGQVELVSSTGLKEINPAKKEEAKKEVAVNSRNADAQTGITADRISSVIATIIQVAVCAVLFALFRKLPKEKQKGLLKGARKLVIFFLSLVTLGIFMGYRTWNNDR